MGKKRATVIRVDEEVLKKAKELGLNVSKTCENLLRMEIEHLEKFYAETKPRNNPEHCCETSTGPLPGFEPGPKAPQACMLPLHHSGHGKTKTNGPLKSLPRKIEDQRVFSGTM